MANNNTAEYLNKDKVNCNEKRLERMKFDGKNIKGL